MTRPPRHVGIFGNREKAEVRSLVPALSRWIQKQGIQVSRTAEYVADPVQLVADRVGDLCIDAEVEGPEHGAQAPYDKA